MHAHWPAEATLALAVPLAWAIDARFGEPRDALHPVAWLGRALAPVGRRLKALAPTPALLGGALVWLAGAAVVVALTTLLQSVLLRLAPWLAVPLLALLLKPTFAWRMLRDEALAVEVAQAQGLAPARARLARLCSRDVRALDAVQVRETTIETVAENLNDSLVAPLFWYALFGLPGAALYRYANTLDAMWGYRDAWEHAGKAAARADDLLSWWPARLSAALLQPTLSRRHWHTLRREAGRTPSPNGGWPMGAMALRLAVRLRKPGVYALNGQAPSPEAAHLHSALAHAARAALAMAALVTAAWLLRALVA
jgi:adenosylcobinamide-phosphate synthase